MQLYIYTHLLLRLIRKSRTTVQSSLLKMPSKKNSTLTSTDDENCSTAAVDEFINESAPAYTGCEFGTETDAVLDNMDVEQIDSYIEQLPKVLAITPYEVFKRISVSYCKNQKMSTEDITAFQDNWGERIGILQQYHRHSVAIVKRRYSDLYTNTVDSKLVELSWGTMKKRFSTDVDIFAGSQKTFVSRMLHFMTKKS